CGAVSATFSAAGLKNSSGQDRAGATKKETYALVRELAMDFKEKHGTLFCRELLADKSRPKQEICEECVKDACEILEKRLLEKE
ncbi:MAG: C-GCAxxG-C-C family protein, partial [Bacillota bacterium]|nr:C-GCAxxG-C-C family protein [Bacillota bacterium]